MPIFEYRARNNNGELVEGKVEAENEAQVLEQVASQGLFPLQATQPTLDVAKRRFKFWKKSVKPKELSAFTRQFEVMYAVGLPLDKILETLANQAINRDFQEALREVKGDVAGGMRLSQAFSRHPKYFNKLYVSMVEVGDVGGILSNSLKELSKVLQSEYILKQRIKAAMLYPKIVVAVLAFMLVGMLVFVFPQFESFYAQQNAELPGITLLVMAMSQLLTNYWYALIVFCLLLYLGWRRVKKIRKVERALAVVAFKIPVFGKLSLMTTNARFSNLIAGLYRAGLPIAYSMGIVADTVDNVCFSEEIRSVQNGLESGAGLGVLLADTKYFSTLVKESCQVGEQTGKIDIVLEEVGRFYSVEIEDLTKNLSTLIEPILLVLLAAVVLFVGMAVYLPIWNLSKTVLPG